jgi:hypothetical protein
MSAVSRTAKNRNTSSEVTEVSIQNYTEEKIRNEVIITNGKPVQKILNITK